MSVASKTGLSAVSAYFVTPFEHENSFNISRICVPNHLNLIFQKYVYALTESNFMEAGLF
jgi:hypothetical protein